MKWVAVGAVWIYIIFAGVNFNVWAWEWKNLALWWIGVIY